MFLYVWEHLVEREERKSAITRAKSMWFNVWLEKYGARDYGEGFNKRCDPQHNADPKDTEYD